ncbi:MAG: phosphoribosyl-AMP cyclohydrolase [Candidatus Sumerlaeia bacterium]|nr:phosphoribosyl-AMP cyclohydrolase [Candidatus Sumerlaeia bacterium]
MNDEQIEKVLDILKYDSAGLVTIVAQDAGSGEVLMIAHANREAVRKTLQTGIVHYWSRSRQKLWLKGETSGHVQRVREIRLDCDGDAVLVKIEQSGGACHEGYRSCFFRVLRDGRLVVEGEKVFDPKTVYETPVSGINRSGGSRGGSR